MTTMAMVPFVSSLLLLPLAIISLLPYHVVVLASSASSSPIQCHSAWTNTLQTIPPSQINDGYCDCPHDGLDEPDTGACSGSMDGMWSGIPAKYDPSDLDAATPSGYFVCPQQPNLRLPLGRANDGICDCCDGADERQSSHSSCPDICDQVLAEERAARAKAREDYEVGSLKRQASISQYQGWYEESMGKLTQLKEVDLAAAKTGQENAEYRLIQAKTKLANEWLRVVNEEVLGTESLMEIVGGGSMTLDDLASFLISLCWLSAEPSRGDIAKDKCVALDRASLDLGILWDYSSNDDDDSLPSFVYLDSGDEVSMADYADKIMLRLEGKDTRGSRNNKKKSKPRMEPEYDASDDPHGEHLYGDDWEDHPDNDDDYPYHDYEEEDHSDNDDDYPNHDYEEDLDSSKSEGGAETEKEEVQQLPDTKILITSLLQKVTVDRRLFMEQGKLLTKYAEKAGMAEEHEESSSGDETHGDGNGEDEENAPDNRSKVDPMALQMVTNSITKSISNIIRGESSAEYAAKFVASVMENSDSPLGEMKNLAIMTLYHSKISLEDVAELVYSTSSSLNSSEEEASGSELSCPAPWSSMCPPSTVALQNGGKLYPPSLIVEAAKKRCEQRENSVGVCAAQEEDTLEFPDSIPDGYYNYYAPQPRGDDDGLVPFFTSMDSLHQIPQNMVELRQQKGELDRTKDSITKKVLDLEKETGGGNKFGLDGELYIMRDICYTGISGKYEYEVCVFGKATQRDAGQKSGGTNLGSWKSEEVDDDGQRTLMWGGGTKCWNGPVRSAEVVVTCGAETKVLTADEPETCRYVFTMESPIGCDEQFKIKNGL